MRSALEEIRSGKFARDFICEKETGQHRYVNLLRGAEEHPIEKAGVRLRGLMGWREKRKPAPALPSRSARPFGK